MAKEFQRTDRVAGTIMRRLSEFMQTEVSDPRLHQVSITAVKVTRDLMQAKIFYSLISDVADKQNIKQALIRAQSFLRKLLADRLQLRVTPELVFVYDESIARADKIDMLLRQARLKHPVEMSEDKKLLSGYDEETI